MDKRGYNGVFGVEKGVETVDSERRLQGYVPVGLYTGLYRIFHQFVRSISTGFPPGFPPLGVRGGHKVGSIN